MVTGVDSVVVNLKNENVTVNGTSNLKAVRLAVIQAGFTPR